MIIFFTDPSFSILLFLFCRPTDRVLTTVSPVEQLIKLVSPNSDIRKILLYFCYKWRHCVDKVGRWNNATVLHGDP